MFLGRFQIAKAFGIPIRIDLSWFIVVLLLSWWLADRVFPQWYPDLVPATYWAMGVTATIGLFTSVLLHEFGHALVARRMGIRMMGITLFIFGGVAEMQDEPPSPAAEFFVAIAGPIVSIAIAILMFAVRLAAEYAGAPVPIIGVAFYLAVINGLLVAFNMVPAFPLDGGRILRSILWSAKNDLRWATRITSAFGSGFGIVLIVGGVFFFVMGLLWQGVVWVMLGMFLRSAAQIGYQQVLIRRALEGELVSRFMKADPVTVPPDITVNRFVSDYIYRHYHKLYPVVEDGRVIGCITTRHIKAVPQEDWDVVTVRELAEPCGATNTIALDTDAMDALSRMNRNESSRLMVMRDGELVGVVTLKDLLNFLSLKVELEERR
jgi:Zn-dependent protease/CBS domain-containing protein